jgi:hypothetical protein
MDAQKELKVSSRSRNAVVPKYYYFWLAYVDLGARLSAPGHLAELTLLSLSASLPRRRISIGMEQPPSRGELPDTVSRYGVVPGIEFDSDRVTALLLGCDQR